MSFLQLSSKATLQALFISCSLLSFNSQAATPLSETLPPLNHKSAPQSFDQMWGNFDPRKEALEVEVIKEWEEDGVILKVLRYHIGTFKGQKAKMAAVYGYPKGAKKLPGLLQIHGGGQYADHRAVLTNAKRGYATLSIAWAGRLSAPDYKVSPHEVKLFWDKKTSDPHYKLTTDWGALDAYHAPSKHGKDAFPSIPTADWTLDPIESPRNNSWFLITLAARRGLTFLEKQPQVDGDKLGVYGHSMGGKLTVATAASDSRIKAAAPSCGGISDRYSEKELHRNTVGDSTQLKRISAPIAFLSPSNDFHGHINNLVDAVKEIKTDQWRVICSPHGSHQESPAAEVAKQLWFDQHLKQSFTWPQSPETSLNLLTQSGSPTLLVTPDQSRAIEAVDVYYCQQGDASGDRNLRLNRINRFWHHAPALKNGNQWQASMPLYAVDKPLWAYANVTYKLDASVSAAGYYYGTYQTNTFIVSSLVKLVTPQALQKAKLKAQLKPSTIIEDFDTDWQQEWFSYKPQTWPHKTHKLYHPAYQAPTPNSELKIKVFSEQDNTLVMGLDKHAATMPLKGGQVNEFSLKLSDFKDYENNSLSSWKGIAELRLSDSETLRSSKNRSQTRRLGKAWQGSAPKFKKLSWSK